MAFDIDCGWMFPKQSTAGVGAVRIVARNKWEELVMASKVAKKKKVGAQTGDTIIVPEYKDVYEDFPYLLEGVLPENFQPLDYDEGTTFLVCKVVGKKKGVSKKIALDSLEDA